jgi:hypothetical protein
MSVPPRSRITRETRLLLIVIALSAAVLFTLSRFRFPNQDAASAVTSTTPLPLERLAARATYDELATIIAELGKRVTPSVMVAQVETNGVSQFVPALRVRSDLLLAHLEPSARVVSFVGSTAPVDVAAYDESRRLALFRVTPDGSPVVDLHPASAATHVPRYVAAVEGTRGGSALRPVFLGRTDPISDERYEQGLIVLGGVLQASAGSLIFGLDGSFVGLCILDQGFAAGIPGPALDAAIERMLRTR